MPLPDRDFVQSVLESNDRDLKVRSAIVQAWLDVEAKYPDRAWWRRKATVRAVMWEHSVDRLMEVVAQDDGLVSINHHDTSSFIADGKVLFRLKKADSKLVSSNYPTQLAQLFHRHDEPDMFGHEGFQRVEIVHTFNKFHTGLDWIGVVARDAKKVIWRYELRRDGGAEVLPFPATPTLPAGKVVLRPNLPDVAKSQDSTE